MCPQEGTSLGQHLLQEGGEHGDDAAGETPLGPHGQALFSSFLMWEKLPGEARQLFGAPSHLRLELESQKILSSDFCCFPDPGPAQF